MDQPYQPSNRTDFDAGIPASDRPSDDAIQYESSAPTTPRTEQAAEVADHTKQRAADVAGTAKDEAVAVKDTAVAAGADVIDSAKQQAGEVISQARSQGRMLLDQGMGELRTQAGNGQHKLAEVVRSFSTELDEMLVGNQQSGLATELANSAQGYSRRAADWLENNGPDEALESVRRYAARNPWKFLAIAAGVGFVGARLVRSISENKSDDQPYRGIDQGRYAPVGDLPGRTDPGYAPATGVGAGSQNVPQEGFVAAAPGYPVAGPGYPTEGPGYPSTHEYVGTEGTRAAQDDGAPVTDPFRREPLAGDDDGVTR